jgi:hypothetical protein
MEELQLEHTCGQWRLFIDSSKVSLKAMLLHNGNKFPSVPLAHTVHMKEPYENLQVLLQKIRYEEHRWNLFADIKAVAMLMVKQGVYTKFCTF